MASSDPDAPLPRTSTIELYRSLSDLSYAVGTARTHARLRDQSGVPVHRASLALLRTLAAAAEPVRMSDLARVLMVRAPHVTREVGNLERQGLVATVKEADDQRVRRVSITEDGQNLVARAEAIGERWLDRALGDFTTDELRTAARVIQHIDTVYRQDEERA